MIADLKPYPAMKDSGVPWLGAVPEHWEVRRNGRLFAQRNETGFAGLPILEVSLKTGVRVREFANSNRKQVMADRDKYKRAAKGDIAYNMMRMWQGAVGVAPVDGLVSPAYVVARPFAETMSGYFGYLFRVGTYMDEVNNYSRGIVSDRNRLYWDEFKQMPSPFPSPAEQQAIVRFLDHADRRIRRYIRAKQKLIKLLEEQKQAIIHRAVTRGLDPNVRLKPSGAEWLGDVPEHWTLARLKDAAVVQTGLTLGKNYRGLATETRPYLRVANVQHGRVDLKHVKHINVPLAEAAGATLKVRDVLMTEGGDIDKLGRGCVWRDEIPGCLHQNHVFAVRCRQDVLVPEFLVGLMTSLHGRTYFQLTAKQTTNLASTNSTTLRAFPVMLPPVAEQRAILDEVARRTSELDIALTRTWNEISLLREYRTRLIADVVTGKLDVHAAAANLPDEVEEPEPLDETDVATNRDEEPENAELEAAAEEVEA
jgi:type I restriction enzyme S subunit